MASLHRLTQDVQHTNALTQEARRGTLPEFLFDEFLGHTHHLFKPNNYLGDLFRRPSHEGI